MDKVDKLAKILWDYHRLNQDLEKADLIFVLGSHDIRVAEYAAELFQKKYAPLIVFSGKEGVGWDVSGFNGRSEAEVFVERAISLGVPEDKIILEPKATNTGENIKYTIELLNKRGIVPKSVIAVQKPYMERRTYATLLAQWDKPQPKFIVTSPNIAYDSYIKDERYPKEHTINVMVGDLQRIKEYPKLGFQVEQDIPDDVWTAYEALVGLGFDKHLVSPQLIHNCEP